MKIGLKVLLEGSANKTMNQTPRVIFTFVLLLISTRTFALEHWFVPTESEIKTVVITNPTNSAQLVWVSKPVDDSTQGSSEVSYQVEAQKKLEIALTDDVNNWRGSSFVHVKAQSKLLSASIVDQTGNESAWPKGSSASYQDFAFFPRTVIVTSETPFEQTVSLNGESLVLAGFGKIRKDVSAGSLKVSGDSRFTVMTISPEVRAVTMTSTPVPLSIPSEGHFFLLTNGTKSQSYVVNLTDPQLIAQAQDQIKNPSAPGGKILVAQVGKTSGGFNRDFNDSKKTPWSWHIEKALHFAELGAQSCDGSPEMVEEFALPYAQSSGIICFWSYRIVKELTASEISH